MNKLVAIAAIMTCILGIGMILAPVGASFPGILSSIQRPTNMLEYTIIGGNPQTVDYSWAYDTASGQIIQNTMDTLIQFNGEHTDQYLPDIATSWTNYPLGTPGVGITTNDPISGLNFENSAQPGPNATYYWRYDFKIRTGVFFQPPFNYSLTAQDVVYSFQRTLIQDRTSGPQWMLEEPLLDINGGSLDVLVTGFQGGDLTNPTVVGELGALIRDAVTTNGTDVFFNLMFPGPNDPAFSQVLCQTWSSIESKQWIDNQVITGAGRPDWPGTWTNAVGSGLPETSWLTYHNPTTSPLDLTPPMEYGSGPFILSAYDTANFWSGTRYEGYWGGWPASFPNLGGATPAGYVDTFTVNFNTAYSTRLTLFTNGGCDFCQLPSDANIPDLFPPSTPPPYFAPHYPLAGLREIYPETLLEYDAFFFTWLITPSTESGNIYPAGSGLHSDGIPADFFNTSGLGNVDYGQDIRTAFADIFNYSDYLQTTWLTNFASEPITAIVPGLPENNASIVGYSTGTGLPTSLNPTPLADAEAELAKIPGMTTTGFTITLQWNSGNVARQQACIELQNSFNALNAIYGTHYTIIVSGGIPWGTYITDAVFQRISGYVIGWLADYPDGYDFALPTYHTGGAFSSWQLYSNSTVDAWINDAATTSNPVQRQNDYNNIQEAAIQNVPDFTIDQPLGAHFERDWVTGWYYNTVYPGVYFYNLWKWNYIPEALDASASQPHSSNLPADVNYDGRVDIKDISVVAKAFLTSYTIFGLSPRWVFRGDVNNDRKIDIKDISYVAKLFGTKSPTWPLYVNQMGINGNPPAAGPYAISLSVGGSVTLQPYALNQTSPVGQPYWPQIPINSYDWQQATWPGSLAVVATTPTYTFHAAATGTYYIHVDITFTVPFPAGSTTTSCDIPVVITVS